MTDVIQTNIEKPGLISRWKETAGLYIEGTKLIFKHAQFFLPLILIIAFFDACSTAILEHNKLQGNDSRAGLEIANILIMLIFYYKYFQYIIKGNFSEEDRNSSVSLAWKLIKIFLYCALMIILYCLPLLAASMVFIVPKIAQWIQPGLQINAFGNIAEALATITIIVSSFWFIYMLSRMWLIQYFVCIDNHALREAHRKSAKAIKGYKLSIFIILIAISVIALLFGSILGIFLTIPDESFILGEVIFYYYPYVIIGYFVNLINLNMMYLLYKRYKHL